MNQAINLTLFGTTACHLCDLCESLIEPIKGNDVVVTKVDIADTPALLERYQLRIPVLRREDTGAELNWPFDLGQLLDWLADSTNEAN